MKPDFWQRQQPDHPLFPDILWERPERRDLAGRLLIVGGSKHGVHAPAAAYQAAIAAGIGTAHVFVPESLRSLTRHIPNVIYGAANEIGSFSTDARQDLLHAALAADGVLLAGDLGRNSETAVLSADMLREYGGLLTLTKDAVDILYADSKRLLERPNTLLVVSFAQLQRLAREAGSDEAFVYSLDFIPLLERLHRFTDRYPAMIIAKHHTQVLCCVNGTITSTESGSESDVWRVMTAARAATYLLHHPTKRLEALTSSLLSEDLQ